MRQTKFIQRLVGGMLVGIASLLPLSAAAEGHLEASMRVINPEFPGGTIVLTLKNTGDAPIPIMVWHTPFAQSGGRLPGAIFKVTDSNGKDVAYRGTWPYLGALTMRAFRTIAPGESLEKEVNLAMEYKFEPFQHYQIDYTLNLTHEPDPRATSSAERATFVRPSQTEAKSNAVIIYFAGDIAAIRNEFVDDDLMCTSAQTLVIDKMRLDASRRISAGEQFMRERYVLYYDNGEPRYRFSPHPRYTRWFGTHNESEPPPFEPGWGLNDNARAYETVVATANRTRDGKLNPRCGCPGWGPDVPAHAEQDSRYTMYFCDLFFDLPDFAAFSSKVGSLMHEYTHYNSFYPGTADYLYGYEKVQDLARENRTNAVMNADNFEYFFTDTTPYDE
ncbi:M35 family metallo-endopeptidase [Luteibacter yeojuensis]|uniref:Lysine-specific metallo-endopeptidase domain-containing protein n=1 Tax=Luteibacter yeojuensis TaxID=345309 RepID=A0A0F3KR61_9GAMM|nr:M35 family metallo-endopeptidase [Luteibacter yeojuensis]KJV33750.1 hypothetical protein VI08_10285 [Luteibacter yeojuensis]